MLFALVAAGAQFLLKAMAPRQAMQRIQDFADNKANSKAPTLEDVCTALRIDPQSPEARTVKVNLPFLVDALANKDVRSVDIEDAKALKRMLGAIEVVTMGGSAYSNDLELLLGSAVDERAASLMGILHPEPFTKGYGEFRDLIASCNRLVKLADTAADKRKGATIDAPLWQLLIKRAQQQPQGADRDYEKGREKFIASVAKESVKSPDALIRTVVECSPTRKKEEPGGEPKGRQTASAAPAGAPGTPAPPPPPAGPSPEEAFATLREKIADFRKSNRTISVEPEKGTTLFEIAPALAKALDAEVLVGSREGLDLKAERDATQPSWKVIVGEDHVATIDLTGGKVVVKGGGEAAWNKYCQAIRFMPIGFHRPGQKLSEDDWLVLSQPEQLKLASEKTLHGLFFAKDGSVPLPAGMMDIDWSEVSATPWTRRAYASDDGSLTVRVQGAGQEAVLEASAKIGDREYTLVEPIEFDRERKIIRRLDGAWYARSSRNRPLEGDLKLENELRKLGFKDGVPVAEMPDQGSILPSVVLALLPGKWTKNYAKQVLAAWCPPKARGSKTEFNDDAVKTLEALRDLVRAMADDETAGFGGDRWQAYKAAHKEPNHPGEFKLQPLQRRENEAEDAFKKRSDEYAAEERRKYEQPLKSWQDWRVAGEKQVQADVRDPVELWRYIQRRQKAEDGDKPANEIDPDLAAVHVLFGLDGLIVAKVKREQLDELLHRISIASLFEGDVNQPWTIDGLGQVSVRVARLEPAALLQSNPLQSPDTQ